MNAKEQAIVTGIANTNGFMFILTQAIIKIGKKTEAVEVFDVNPEIKLASIVRNIEYVVSYPAVRRALRLRV